MDTFYMVWNSNSGYTMDRHREEIDAQEEAERLAAKHPQQQIFVLKALSMSTTEKPVTTIDLDLGPLPF